MDRMKLTVENVKSARTNAICRKTTTIPPTFEIVWHSGQTVNILVDWHYGGQSRWDGPRRCISYTRWPKKVSHFPPALPEAHDERFPWGHSDVIRGRGEARSHDRTLAVVNFFDHWRRRNHVRRRFVVVAVDEYPAQISQLYWTTMGPKASNMPHSWSIVAV